MKKSFFALALCALSFAAFAAPTMTLKHLVITQANQPTQLNYDLNATRPPAVLTIDNDGNTDKMVTIHNDSVYNGKSNSSQSNGAIVVKYNGGDDRTVSPNGILYTELDLGGSITITLKDERQPASGTVDIKDIK